MTEDGASKTWTLVSCRDQTVAVDHLEHALSAVLSVPISEARMIARRGRGILLEELRLEQARDLQAAFEQSGHDVLVLPQREVVGEPQIKQIRQLRPADDGVSIQLGYDREQLPTVPWEHIDLISAGLVGTQTFWSRTRDRAVKNLPRLEDISEQNLRDELTSSLARDGIGVISSDLTRSDDFDEQFAFQELEQLARTETEWLIDLYCLNVPVRYRLNRKQAIYPRLEEDSNTRTSSTENFLHTVTELIYTGEQVITTPISFDLFSSSSYFEQVFYSMQHFVRYSRWYLTMVQQGHIDHASPAPFDVAGDEDE